MIVLPSYHAKQIAGRAGRYGTDYPEGFVTTYVIFTSLTLACDNKVISY